MHIEIIAFGKENIPIKKSTKQNHKKIGVHSYSKKGVKPLAG